jgi:hypothetical protein
VNPQGLQQVFTCIRANHADSDEQEQHARDPQIDDYRPKVAPESSNGWFHCASVCNAPIMAAGPRHLHGVLAFFDPLFSGRGEIIERPRATGLLFSFRCGHLLIPDHWNHPDITADFQDKLVPTKTGALFLVSTYFGLNQ